MATADHRHRLPHTVTSTAPLAREALGGTVRAHLNPAPA